MNYKNWFTWEADAKQARYLIRDKTTQRPYAIENFTGNTMGAFDRDRSKGFLNMKAPDRGRMLRNPKALKNVGDMSPAQINKELASLEKKSDFTDRFIAEGWGNKGLQEIYRMDHPLANKWRLLHDRYMELRNEVARRYGPGGEYVRFLPTSRKKKAGMLTNPKNIQPLDVRMVHLLITRGADFVVYPRKKMIKVDGVLNPATAAAIGVVQRYLNEHRPMTKNPKGARVATKKRTKRKMSAMAKAAFVKRMAAARKKPSVKRVVRKKSSVKRRTVTAKVHTVKTATRTLARFPKKSDAVAYAQAFATAHKCKVFVS